MSFFNLRTHEDFGTSNNIPMALNSTFEYENKHGMSSILFKIIPPTGGTVVFEGLANTNTWVSITLRSLDRDQYVSETDVTEHIIGSISCLKKFRVKVTVAGTADGTISGRSAWEVSTLEGVEFANPPHKIGLQILTKPYSFTALQTGTVLWLPTIGTRFAITNLFIQGYGPTDGFMTIFDEIDISANYIFRAYFDVSLNNSISIPQNFNVPIIGQAVDNRVRLTTSTAVNGVIIIYDYEIKG